MGFRIIRPGTFSILVDQGQPRHRGVGLPLGGPADDVSFTLGQALVGNRADARALEITLLGPDLEATATHGCVVMGAPFLVHLRGESIPVGTTFTVRPGDLLHIGTTGQGCRAYLCVRGGFANRPHFGSTASWLPIQKGELLECPESLIQRRWLPDLPLLPRDLHRLRVLSGSHLSTTQRERLAATLLRVKSDSNRMGLRLEAQPALPVSANELPSAPVTPGCIQLPASGQPILLGKDAQSIGGYPRIAHVITADWPKVGQLAPNQFIHLEWVQYQQAVHAYREQQRWLSDCVQHLLDSLY